MTQSLVWISRKLTENIVATDVPKDQVPAILSALSTGVYSVENPDGTEIAEAVVRNGRTVRYRMANRIDETECAA